MKWEYTDILRQHEMAKENALQQSRLYQSKVAGLAMQDVTRTGEYVWQLPKYETIEKPITIGTLTYPSMEAAIASGTFVYPMGVKNICFNADTRQWYEIGYRKGGYYSMRTFIPIEIAEGLADTLNSDICKHFHGYDLYNKNNLRVRLEKKKGKYYNTKGKKINDVTMRLLSHFAIEIVPISWKKVKQKAPEKHPYRKEWKLWKKERQKKYKKLEKKGDPLWKNIKSWTPPKVEFKEEQTVESVKKLVEPKKVEPEEIIVEEAIELYHEDDIVPELWEMQWMDDQEKKIINKMRRKLDSLREIL